MKRISDKHPIYLHPRLKGIMPDNAVYSICKTTNDLPMYIGNTRNPIKRYERYIRAIKNPASENHESAYKISQFRKNYVPNESPVMILIDFETDGNTQEKMWKQHYEKKGSSLINNTGKMKRHAKVSVQNFSYNLIDQVFDNWPVLVGFIAIMVVSYIWMHKKGL